MLLYFFTLLTSHTLGHPSELGASLVLSLFFIGLETAINTLPLQGSVAECYPRLLELVCLELHRRVSEYCLCQGPIYLSFVSLLLRRRV